MSRRFGQSPHWTTTQRPAEASCARVMPVECSIRRLSAGPVLCRRHVGAGKKNWAHRRRTAACPEFADRPRTRRGSIVADRECADNRWITLRFPQVRMGLWITFRRSIPTPRGKPKRQELHGRGRPRCQDRPRSPGPRSCREESPAFRSPAPDASSCLLEQSGAVAPQWFTCTLDASRPTATGSGNRLDHVDRHGLGLIAAAELSFGCCTRRP